MRFYFLAPLAIFAFSIFAVPAAHAQYPTLPEIDSGSGAESWYYEAKRLEDEGLLATEAGNIAFMLRLAFDFGEPMAAKESGRSLVALYKASGDMAQARLVAERWMDYFGPDWVMFQTVILSQISAGEHGGVLASLEKLSKALPSAAKSRSTELAFYSNSAKAALGDFSWASGVMGFLSTPTIDSWTAKSLRLAASAPGIDQQSAALALLRSEFFDKNYDLAAAKALDAAPSLRAASAPRHLISEAGKAFAGSKNPRAGVDFFADFFRSSQDQPPDPDTISANVITRGAPQGLWVAAYYLARCWSISGDDYPAGVLFLGLTESAPSPADSDGALWYWLDITMRRIEREELDGSKRALQFAALTEASTKWKNPANFADIYDEFDRSLLKEKSWNDVLALRTLAGNAVPQDLRTRLSYQSARLVEEKIADSATVRDGGDAYSATIYASILADNSAEDYYRTMAAWRLRQNPLYVSAMPNLSGSSIVFDSMQQVRQSVFTPVQGEPAAMALVREYLERDLDGPAAKKALEFIGSIGATQESALAFEFSARGEHYAALRFARDALAKGAGKEYPALYGLLYPLAWEGLVAQAASIPSIPKALAYGIIRSESVFDPEAISYAGAVGLSQLMPATAAETARGLKIPSYSLTDPEDNLTIGFTYYSYMLSRFGSKPVRAMFAYNAGPGRMTTWAKESGELPDDLLLETLNIAQPRQYAKNIIHATLSYAAIHYALDPLAVLDYLLLGTPLPAPQAAMPMTEPELPPESEPAIEETGFLGNDPR